MFTIIQRGRLTMLEIKARISVVLGKAIKYGIHRMFLAALILSSAGCGGSKALPPIMQTALPSVQAGVKSGMQTAVPVVESGLKTAMPTVKAGVQTAVPAIEGEVKTVVPTLKAGVATVLPAIETAMPSQLRPGEGLPLPGTLVASALNLFSQEEAALAIEAYARDVFSTTVDVTVGRGVVGDLNLPMPVESSTTTALRLSSVTYLGLLSDGAASLSFASGTTGKDLASGIQQASMGILSFRRSKTMPSSAEDALALIQENFPSLVNQPLVLDSAENGYVFRTKEPNDWSLRGGKITLKKSMVLAGISPGRTYGQINVWAVVSTGVLAVPFLPQ